MADHSLSPSFFSSATLTRRGALRMVGGLALASAGAGAALSAEAGARKLVLVILRGALDGLAAVAPYADDDYLAARGRLALAAPGEQGGVLAIGNGFGLHPSLAFLHAEWSAGRLGVMHAAASAYRDRSHFDGQDVLESGGAAVFALSDGWLNRALGAVDNPGKGAVAISNALPLVLRGAAPASNFAPSIAPPADDDTLMRLGDLYADDPLLAPALAKGIETAQSASGMSGDGAASPMRRGADHLRWPALAATAGRLIAPDEAPIAAVLAFDGWDTHANQGGASGALAVRLKALDDSLAALKEALGSAYANTMIVVATEFGRTVRINGTGGTDHGTGGAAFALGGAMNGGRMLGDWPGLGAGALHEGRDVAPANDLRSLFAAILREHWGVDRRDLESRVFPGFANAGGLQGVVKR